MALLLRRTGLSDDSDPNDWSVINDGVVVGHICEDLAVADPEWFWSIFASGPGPRRLAKAGRAPTLDEAKAQFRAAWEAREAFKSDGQQRYRRRFEIAINGTPRSYRDREELAIEAATWLKTKNPNSQVTVRDR